MARTVGRNARADAGATHLIRRVPDRSDDEVPAYLDRLSARHRLTRR